jgi:hypothetical protein
LKEVLMGFPLQKNIAYLLFFFGSSDFSVGNPLVYNGSEEDWSHAGYGALPLPSGYRSTMDGGKG